MQVGVLSAYISVNCVYVVAEEVRRGKLDPLELEFHVVVSCHMGPRNRTQVLWKNRQCALKH